RYRLPNQNNLPNILVSITLSTRRFAKDFIYTSRNPVSYATHLKFFLAEQNMVTYFPRLRDFRRCHISTGSCESKPSCRNVNGEVVMDDYTQKTKEWLNNRFKECDEHGVYFAHQPIYGFRNEPCEPGYICRYILTFQIMRMLSLLQFDTLLDVGGAEGYKAFLAQQLFEAKVTTSDLSEEACKRAEELFRIPAVPADIHDLPFDNNEFDVILCSESLEHVTDYKKAAYELLRVAKKAVIITVPHESENITEHNKHEGLIHSHIHNFDLTTFNYLQSEGYEVISKRLFNYLSVIPASLIDARPRTHCDSWKHPKLLTQIYNLLVPVAGQLLNKKAASLLLELDDFMCKIVPLYKANLYLILKDNNSLLKKEVRHVSPNDILGFQVPHHNLSVRSISHL